MAEKTTEGLVQIRLSKSCDNLIENIIRLLAIERKKFLFCGNDDAAEDAAIMYSLLRCCKAAEVECRQWFVHVLNHIHDYNTDYSMDLAELLPHNLKSQQL
jgi:hypothetical protein